MQQAIELRGVRKQLGNFTLGPLNLRIPKGCIIGYIGENGAGKSTTIKLLLGLLYADAGEISLFGKKLEQRSPEMKKDVAYVFEDLYLPEDMTVENTRKFHERLYGRAWENDRFTELVSRFKLPQDKTIKEFSRGMIMQLGLALAMSHGAKLLLLDEATSGLDPVIRDDVLDLLLEYIQDEDHTVFVSSHILSDLEKAADYIAFIHQGQLLFIETKDELVNQHGIATLSREQIAALDPAAIVGVRHHQFGSEALLRRDLVPDNLDLEKVTVEDIMVYMIKGDHS